jgi:hypothetical protein
VLNNQHTVDKESVIAEEVDGVGDKGSVNVETTLETFLEDFQSWEYFSQLSKYQISRV